MKKSFCDCLPWLERQILAFPLVVVFTACATFLLGGHCAAWQWWVSAGLVLALPFAARADRRAGLVSGGLFLVTLAILLVCVRLASDSYWVDAVAYHLPATRFLIDGWNPWTTATPSALGAAMAVSPDEMRVYHVLFIQKAAWVFNAVAFFFHRDVQSVTTPIEFYAYFMAVVALWRTLDTWRRPFRLMLALALWTCCCGLSSEVVGLASMTVVDDVCAVAVFALMVAMVRDLARNEVTWWRLVPLTLLAIVVKSSGALACFVLWALFAGVALFRNRRQFFRLSVRFAVAAAGMALFFAVVCASPYLAAYRDYGHPLYPLATVDEEKLPTTDFIADLDAGTPDFDAMGPAGLFVNAYVSPALAQGYYRRKLKTDVFHPTCMYWRGTWCLVTDAGGEAETSLTSLSERLTILAAFALLLCLRGWRLVPVMALLVLVAAPSHTYGYLRYFKWVEILLPFAALALAERSWAGLEARFVGVRAMRIAPVILAAAFAGWFGWNASVRSAADLSAKRRIRTASPDCVYASIFAPRHWQGVLALREFARTCSDPRQQLAPLAKFAGVRREDSSRTAINAFKTLARHLPNLRETQVLPLTGELRERLGSALRYEPQMGVYVSEGGLRDGD